jgi:hypothetical protein
MTISAAMLKEMGGNAHGNAMGEEWMQAKSNKKNNKNDSSRERQDLQQCYGEIGISAVAAALHYSCDARNPAYAPAIVRPQDEREDVVA